MSQKKQKFLKIGLPIVVLLLAAGAVAYFILTKDPPEQSPRAFEGVLVETEALERSEHELNVHVQGVVMPARQVQLRPEVQGKLVEVNPALEPGGLLQEGEFLARIDPRPYEQALDRAQAALAEAEANLALAKGRNEVAEADWAYFQENTEERPDTINRSLALREPQLDIAEARVASARAQVDSARLNLEYTTIRVPFDSVVLQEQIDAGQYVSPQSPMATLVGSDAFWLRAAVPANRLKHLKIPGYNAEVGGGSAAAIRRDYQDSTTERSGEVLRLYSDLEPRGRMARLLIRIDDPLGLGGDADKPMPLLLNSYVRAEISSEASGNYVAVPREAVHGGDEVYLYEDGKLAIRTLDVAWGLPEKVLVEDGLEPGERIIMTNLSSPVEGMKLRRVEPSENTSKQETSEDG
ncbi:MAG: efflux RND transporter periplasmic adaptor subunit [Verrucomicrobiota bacterium]